VFGLVDDLVDGGVAVVAELDDVLAPAGKALDGRRLVAAPVAHIEDTAAGH